MRISDWSSDVCSSDLFVGRRIGDVDPDLAVDDLHRVAPEPVAADQRLSAGKVELTVMPVAGEDAVSAAALRERPFHQRVALVRAAVVAGEDAAGAGENRDLLAARLDEVTSLLPQFVEQPTQHQNGKRVGS